MFRKARTDFDDFCKQMRADSSNASDDIFFSAAGANSDINSKSNSGDDSSSEFLSLDLIKDYSSGRFKSGVRKLKCFIK